MEEYIYPMGTVVRLKDETRNDKLSEYAYMIIDRFIIVGKEYYEYKSNVYPLGNVFGGNKGIMFNNEDIGEVLHKGYMTAESIEVTKVLQDKLIKDGINKKINNK
ncbi:MAG: DUF4176 domain-containing protein [Mycoplasmatales bacterium]